MQLKDKDKYKIITQEEDENTYKKIASKVGVSKSTVSRTIRKFEKYGTVNHMGGNGRPPIIDSMISSFILNERRKNPKLSLRKMAILIYNELKIAISHITIKRWFNEHNIFAYTPISKPLLTANHIKRRFEAAKRILFMPEEDIKRIIFTDESKFNLFYSDGKISVWREPGSGLKPENLNKTVKHGGGSVMVWGCFSYHGVGRLVFIDGIMDAPAYINIISTNLRESASKMDIKNFIFQQDNDPKHTSHLVNEFLEDAEINLFEDWPAQSPDLNPIESFWHYIKVKVAERQPTSIKALKEIIVEVWNQIPKEMCQKYALSFKKRALAIYRAKGEHIDY